NRARREILAALLDREIPRGAPPPTPRLDLGAVAEAQTLAGTYVDSRSGHRTLEKLAALARYTKVVAGADGSSTLACVRYVPIGSRVFESEDGEGRIAFRLDRAGRVTHLFESRSIAKAYERVPWYGTLDVQLAWLFLCGLGFFWLAAYGLTVAIFRRPRNRT